MLGSLGCGNIARELFRIARPLGFSRMLACDPFAKPEQVQSLGVELVDMDTVFRESDFVTVNTFLNESTRGLVGERYFRLMKPTAYLINTARGPIVQHDALVKALREKWIAGAGIDVFPRSRRRRTIRSSSWTMSFLRRTRSLGQGTSCMITASRLRARAENRRR